MYQRWRSHVSRIPESDKTNMGLNRGLDKEKSIETFVDDRTPPPNQQVFNRSQHVFDPEYAQLCYLRIRSQE